MEGIITDYSKHRLLKMPFPSRKPSEKTRILMLMVIYTKGSHSVCLKKYLNKGLGKYTLSPGYTEAGRTSYPCLHLGHFTRIINVLSLEQLTQYMLLSNFQSYSKLRWFHHVRMDTQINTCQISEKN